MRFNTRTYTACALYLLGMGLALTACQDETLVKGASPEELRREGKYLSAVRAETDDAATDAGASAWEYFDKGTPYRLVIVSGDENTVNDATTRADHLRGNLVAYEDQLGATPYINVGENASDLLGFAPMSGESDGRKALDFYGFTYGDVNTSAGKDYISLSPSGTPSGYDGLYRQEDMGNGSLNDLLYGRLLNQTAATSGSPSRIPFRHAFSQLVFEALQSEVKETVVEEAEKGKGRYDIQITGITLTGSYQKGQVALMDGKVTVSEKYGENTGPSPVLDEEATKLSRIPTSSKTYGSLIVYPSASESLSTPPEGASENGYPLGLVITLEGGETDLKRYCGDNVQAIDGKADRNKGTLTLSTIPNNLADPQGGKAGIGTYSNAPLYLQQGVSYILRLAFLDDEFLITVIPQVAEWIPGEKEFDSNNDGNKDSQMQVVGQPIYFDGKLWCDRNLGADDYDAEHDDFERTVGYFYQQYRNIPYWPFKPSSYSATNHPKPEDKRTVSLNEFNYFSKTNFKVFPMVSPELIKQDCFVMPYSQNSWWTYIQNASNAPSKLLDIPEKEQVSQWNQSNQKQTFAFSYDYTPLEWSQVSNQPVPQGYHIPTEEEFLSIFPGTPHAGNYAFIGGGNNEHAGTQWGPGANNSNDTERYLDNNIKVMRICVPYYSIDNNDVPAAGSQYLNEWEHWSKIENNVSGGCFPADSEYKTKDAQNGINWGPKKNRNNDPNGDPSDGYCSVYIISREEGSEYTLEQTYGTGYNYTSFVADNVNMLQLQKWGTIYGIKKVGTSEAYRMRWQVICKWSDSNPSTGLLTNVKHPFFYVRIDRYRCTAADNLTRENYMRDYQWDSPVATTYFPISGLVDAASAGANANAFGNYYNCGSECMYATSSKVNGVDFGKSGVVLRLKGSARNLQNTFISVARGVKPMYGMQIRLIQD